MFLFFSIIDTSKTSVYDSAIFELGNSSIEVSRISVVDV